MFNTLGSYGFLTFSLLKKKEKSNEKKLYVLFKGIQVYSLNRNWTTALWITQGNNKILFLVDQWIQFWLADNFKTQPIQRKYFALPKPLHFWYLYFLVHVDIIQQLLWKCKLFPNNIIQAFNLENMFTKYLGCSNQNNLQKCRFWKHFTWPKSEYLEKKCLVMFTVHSPVHYIVLFTYFRTESKKTENEMNQNRIVFSI